MPVYTTREEPIAAKEDTTVYKVFLIDADGNFVSPSADYFFYPVGEDLVEKKFGQTELLAYSEFIGYPYLVRIGFHSFVNKNDAITWAKKKHEELGGNANVAVVKCTIPKESLVFPAMYHDGNDLTVPSVVSSKIRLNPSTQ
jgi:hypothetical protein